MKRIQYRMRTNWSPPSAPKAFVSRLLAAISDVPRAEFVPPALARRAYLDTPLPIGHEQVTTQASLIGRIPVSTGVGFLSSPRPHRTWLRRRTREE
jgi:hypothetical protein